MTVDIDLLQNSLIFIMKGFHFMNTHVQKFQKINK